MTDPFLKPGGDYEAMRKYWETSTAIVDGIDAIRAGKTKYMPKFAGESDPAYENRLKHTRMTNVFSDIVESLASKPFENGQEIKFVADDENVVPQQLVEFAYDVDGAGNDLTAFGSLTFEQGITAAIVWLFVDNPKKPASIVSVADEKAAGIKPYWSIVPAFNVLDARSKVIGGKEHLTYIKIFEPGSNGAPDAVRTFTRNDAGLIEWAVYEKTNETQVEKIDGVETQFKFVEGAILTIDQIPLVPFYTGRRKGRSWQIKPPLRAAAELQIELYQDESGLKYAKRLTGYPMLSGNGVTPPKGQGGKPEPLDVGPNCVLYGGTDAQGNAGSWEYVEPSATSLTFMAGDNEKTIQQLRELGKQPLTAQSGNLTVITAAAAADKSKSAVSAWAYLLKNSLENALVITCKFLGVSVDVYDPTVYVHTEFDDFSTSDDTTALGTARANRDISRKVYVDELQRRKILSPDYDYDTDTKELLDELPGDGIDTDPDNPDAPPV